MGEGGRWVGDTGKGTAFEHFCFPLSGRAFDHKFCPMLRPYEFNRAEDWVHIIFLYCNTAKAFHLVFSIM